MERGDSYTYYRRTVIFCYNVFMKETIHDILIFTDGGALGNPGPGGWGAIIFDTTKGTIVEIGGHEKNTTNNRMEMMAIIRAIREAPKGLITVYSDSKYVIQGITQWVFGWQKNDWKTKNKTDVANRDLWQELLDILQGKEVEWQHVAGHAGISGNERVDVIANTYAQGKQPELFSGKSSEYSIDLKNLTQNPQEASGKKSTGKAYSYVSMVDGKVERHATWAECEARVKGKKARFKKTFSKEDEQNLIEEWLNLSV